MIIPKFILASTSTVCLDSESRKPLPYSANTVTAIQELKLPSRIESVDEAAFKADEFAKEQGLGDDFVSAIDLAIRESVANAVKHGNKFAEEKTVDLTLARTPEGFEITVRDYGNGFALEEIPDPTNPENLLKANGRGILFMRSFMDVVEWSNHEDGGTVVKMVKHR
jgi:serine/threonine-protein kinase RsbW